VTNLNLDKSNPASVSILSVKDGEPKNEDDIPDEQISPAEQSLLQKIIRKGLVETKKTVDIQRQDPSSPLHSIKKFDELHLWVSQFLVICSQ